MNTSKEQHYKTDDNTEKGQPVHINIPPPDSSAIDAIEDDGTPVLDEKDLEENGLSEEEAENIIWDEPQKDSK